MEKNTDLRIIKTKKALCDAFVELMNEKTFDAITVNELCDRAMVRRATFYKHFMDKYDFFSYFIRYYRTKHIGQAEEQFTSSSLAAYCIFYFESFLNFARENPVMIKNMLGSNMLPVVMDIFAEETHTHLVKIIRSSNLPECSNGLPAEVLSSFITGGMIQVYRYWIAQCRKITETELKQNIEVLLHSFFPTEQLHLS